MRRLALVEAFRVSESMSSSRGFSTLVQRLAKQHHKPPVQNITHGSSNFDKSALALGVFCVFPLSYGLLTFNPPRPSLTLRPLEHLARIRLSPEDSELVEALNTVNAHDLLLSGERSLALGVLEAFTRRPALCREAINAYGDRLWQWLLRELTSKTLSGDQSGVLLRCLLDVFAVLRPEERQVPDIKRIEGLVQSAAFEADPWGEEVRCLLLLKLLENKANAELARESRVLRDFLTVEEDYRPYNSLFTWRAKLYSSECTQFKHICRALVYPDEEHGQLSQPRKSPSLANKLLFRAWEVTIGISLMYTIVRYAASLESIASINLTALKTLVIKNAVGSVFLEGVYRVEDDLIDSGLTREFMPSLCMNLANGALCLAVIKSRLWLAGPFFVLRFVRDVYGDPFRAVGSSKAVANV
jgi:hypothetical protein